MTHSKYLMIGNYYVFLSFSHFFLRQAFQPCNMLNGRCFKAVWIQRNAKETKSVSESLSEARKNIVWQKYICPHLKAMWRSSKQHHPDHWEESCPNHILWCGLYTAFIILILFFSFFLFFQWRAVHQWLLNRSSHHPYHHSINSCGLFHSQRCAEAMQGSHLSAARLWVASTCPEHGGRDACCLLLPLPHFFLICMGEGGAWAPFPALRAIYDE